MILLIFCTSGLNMGKLHNIIEFKVNSDTLLIIALLIPLLFLISGCTSPHQYRIKADKAALEIIKEKQRQVLGEVQEFQNY